MSHPFLTVLSVPQGDAGSSAAGIKVSAKLSPNSCQSLFLITPRCLWYPWLSGLIFMLPSLGIFVSFKFKVPYISFHIIWPQLLLDLLPNTGTWPPVWWFLIIGLGNSIHSFNVSLKHTVLNVWEGHVKDKSVYRRSIIKFWCMLKCTVLWNKFYEEIFPRK